MVLYECTATALACYKRPIINVSLLLFSQSSSICTLLEKELLGNTSGHWHVYFCLQEGFPCLFQHNSSSSSQRVYLPAFPGRLPRPFPLSKSTQRYTVNTYHGETTVHFIFFSRIRYEFLEMDTFSRSEHTVQK